MQSSVNLLPMELANKSMDVLWQRANLISENISNADTPGYKEQTVSFEDSLAQALSGNTMNEETLSSVNPQVSSVLGSANSNGNSVDLETQMVELARNQLQYNYMEKAISNQLTMLQSAASEGKN